MVFVLADMTVVYMYYGLVFCGNVLTYQIYSADSWSLIQYKDVVLLETTL